MPKYDGQTSMCLQYIEIGRTEVLRETEADRILRTLERRGLVVTSQQAERIRCCDDLDVLRAWRMRAFEVDAVEGPNGLAERLTPVDRYRWSSEFAREYVGLGRAWQEAQQDGNRDEVLDFMLTALALRGLVPTAEQWKRMCSCDDLEVLEGWGLRLFEIETVDDLFV